MHSLIILLNYISGYKVKILLASIYSILNLIFDAMPEVILGFAIDTVVNRNQSFLSSLGLTNPFHQIVLLGTIAIVIYFLESVFQYLSEIEWRYLAQIMQHKLRIDTYAHIQHLDMSFFEEQSTGTILSILVDDINLLENFFNSGANDILQLIFGTSIICSIFFYISPTIALLSIFPIPLILIISFYFKEKLNKIYAKVRAAASSLSAQLANNLPGIPVIKSYTTEKYEVLRLEEKSNEYLKTNWFAIQVSSLFIPVVRMAILVGHVIAIILGGLFTLQGKIPIGAYSMLIFLMQRLLWPFKDLAQLVDQYQRAMTSAKRVLKLLTAPITIKEGDKKLNIQSVQGKIFFDHVSFAYPNGVKVFENLTFEILPGQTVGFVGPTGSGKTTIIKLLLRFYDVQSGDIYLDNIPLKTYTLKSIRKAFGLVSQDGFLVDGTIKDNIAYGSFDASFNEIIQAAKIAEAYDFIMNLPEQFESPVGERGQKLSGGQKQRISIARAILKNPPIFIFDEATSAVDNETERAIQHSLNTITKDHTTLIIAHRLSTIRNADRIIVLDKGKIIETGTHDELIHKAGIYANLWELQTGNST